MGVFLKSSKKITKREFEKELPRALRKKKIFSDVDMDEIEKVFQGDLYEGSSSGDGITEEELKKRFEWLRENKSKHKLDRKELDALEAEMRKLL